MCTDRLSQEKKHYQLKKTNLDLGLELNLYLILK